MTDFSRTKRPPKDKCFDFQPDSLEWIRRTNGFQKSKWWAFPPMGNPKYTNGRFPTLQCIVVAATTNQDSDTLTPANWLFEKFTFKPNKDLNNMRTARIERTLAQDFSPKISVSSANCKWDTTTGFLLPTL